MKKRIVSLALAALLALVFCLSAGAADTIKYSEARIWTAEAGLSPLSLSPQLSRVARAKSQDMKDKKYFDHTSPTYGSPFEMMKAFGISYSIAGENIAKGQPTPEAVVKAWMNSPGHRANILNPAFTQIGVGYVGGAHYWTQMFIG